MRGLRTALYIGAMAALTAGCSVSVEEGETVEEGADAGESGEAGDSLAAQLEQGIVDDYASRDMEVVDVTFAPEADGITYSGTAVVVEPNSGEEIEVACLAEPSDDGQYSFNCEQ